MLRTFLTINGALPSLAQALLNSDEVGSRNGRVHEIVGATVVLEEPWQRYISNPARKANIAAQIAETMWVLSGRNDIEWLSHYLPRAEDFSDDGSTWRGGYGPRLRSWPRRDGSDDVVDQLRHVVDLLRNDPLTRQAVINIYDPVTDTAPGRDIPCNNWIAFYSRLGRLHMHVTIRSNDLIWGWSGINAFEWSTLQEIVAAMLGVAVGPLRFNIGSLHVYDKHWKRAREIAHADDVKPFSTPVRFGHRLHSDDDGVRYWLHSSDDPVGVLDDLIAKWFHAEEAIRTGHRAAAHLIDEFPEPMLKEWLQVIRWWWTGDMTYLSDPVIFDAVRVAHQPPKRDNVIPLPVRSTDPFVEFADALHREKHAAYGESWKRRGEMLGILANIARKVDRLGGAETADETSADTAIDLMLYLAKYRWWLTDQGADCPVPLRQTWSRPFSDHTEPVKALIEVTPMEPVIDGDRGSTEYRLRHAFDALEDYAKRGSVNERARLVNHMLVDATRLARMLWRADGDDYRGMDAD